MKNISRADLKGEGRLVGFGFDEHPLSKGDQLHYVFYWIEPKDFVLCLSSVKGKGDPELMRPHLGELVPAEEFAPYAERGINGATLEDFRQIMTEAMPHVQFEWWEQ